MSDLVDATSAMPMQTFGVSTAAQAPSRGYTADLGHFAVTARYTAEERELAVRPVLDTVGVMIAGTNERECRVLADWVAGQSAPGRSIVAGVWSRVQPSLAAFTNGALAHLLDFDDVATSVKGHPSAVIVPTILALSSESSISGAALLDAYLVGLDVSASVAAQVQIRAHYDLGWHATSTIGVVAATAAACRLVRVSEGTAISALGMAVSFAAGSRQNFGTLTKSLHVGRAAEAAVVATTLASLGATADPAALEGELGFMALFGRSDQELRGAGIVTAGQGIKAGLTVKSYPCCYQSHRAIDASLALRDRLSVDDITSIAVTVQPGSSGSLMHHRPQSSLQAKFSGEYVVAAALLDGRVNLATFEEAAVYRPAAQALLRRVTLSEAACPPIGPAEWQGGYAVVEVRLLDGSVIAERVDIPLGDPRRPLDSVSLRQKFLGCLSYAGLTESQVPTAHLIESLPSVAEVGDVLRFAAEEANSRRLHTAASTTELFGSTRSSE